MRILVFGKSKKRTKTTGFIVDAFRRAGHTVRWIRYGRLKRFLGRRVADLIMTRLALSFKPDYAFVISRDCPGELMARLKDVCTVSVFSAIYRPEPDPKLIERVKHAHLLFLTNEGQLDTYNQAGGRPVIYLPQACDDRTHRKTDRIEDRYASDMAFIGGADEERAGLIRKLRDVCDARVYGPGWDNYGMTAVRYNVTPKIYAKICASASIMLGLNRAKDVRLCFSNRTWITLGCGGFLLTSYVPGLEDMFQNRKHLVWYRSEEECIELTEYYLSKPEERRKIAEAGYSLAHEAHTYEHFVEKVLKEVEKIRNPSS